MAVAKCNCESKYQDEKYGDGNRVYTPMKNGHGHCTVCGKEITVIVKNPESETSTKKKGKKK